MTNKIEFTDNAKKEISRIISKDATKSTLEYQFLGVDVQVLNIISHLKIKFKITISCLIKQL